MSLPPQLKIALKEWKSVCDALETGRQIILLRKGGIYESAGEFEIEHRQFLLFPTYLHQKSEMLKGHPALPQLTTEPTKITLTTAAQITDIVPMPRREQMDALDSHHIWTKPLIDMRYGYKPENPLYLLVVRAYKLIHEVTIENTPAYAGCKSWVPLESPIETAAVQTILPDQKFAASRQEILRHVIA
jgi:hypothetical protein